MGIPDHLTCLLRSLYAGQEATVRTRHGTMDWFQIGKGVHQGCILSPCLFNLYAEYIMQNAGLDEARAGIKTAGRNINKLRYADDTRKWRRTEQALLMKVKEETEKAGLKSNIQKMKIMASGPITSWQSEAMNWYFWTVVLEKTLESPLDCKEIQLVHPKGNQSWIFVGRTDAEAETPILLKLGSCLTLGNELSEETHVLTRHRFYWKRSPGWRAAG